jgi:hypothetical protein
MYLFIFLCIIYFFFFSESLDIWRSEERAAVWLDIPLDKSHLIASAGAQGFLFHHAEGQRSMMKLWLRTDRPDKTPQFATHQVGVSGRIIMLFSRLV